VSRDATFGALGTASDAALDAERFRMAFEDSAIGMSIEDLDGRFMQVNSVLCAMLGYSSAELLTMGYQDVCHPDDLEGPEYLASLRDGSVRRIVRECRHTCADGTVIWVRVHVGVISDGHQALFYTAQTEDITAQRSAEARLIQLAEHDTLTGLPNRQAFADGMTSTLESGEQVALLFVDLDRFKLVNDTLGHAAGDELLVAVAARLRSAVRNSEVVARIGGDEFVILATPVTCVGDAERVAERLLAALVPPFRISGRSLFVTASVGIALAGGDVASAEDTLRAADLAMYRAKTTGKARVVVFDESLRRDAELRLGVEQDLYRALAAPGQLRVWFQPVLSVATGRVVAAEALVRWQHPRRGLLLPGEFLSVAEETGLMSPITKVVLAQSLTQARRWRDQGLKMIVSVNLSCRQLEEPGFEQEVADALDAAGLDPADLCVEVTETALLGAAGHGPDALRKLRELGVAVAIDDFGQGYSSLSYLRSYPADIVKLDRAFVNALETNPRDAAIVGGIIQLAHALGMICIAEGVERPGQLQRLTDLGCDQIQGFLLSRPCPPDELVRRLVASPDGAAPRLAPMVTASPLIV
jgi:diguanylate cyclase (GGDEF)-like protein/PAS domain S-box-containing protein